MLTETRQLHNCVHVEVQKQIDSLLKVKCDAAELLLENTKLRRINRELQDKIKQLAKCVADLSFDEIDTKMICSKTLLK